MLQNLSVPKKLMLSFAAVIGACGMATMVVLWTVTILQRADAANARPEAKDAVGNLLSDGDSVVLIKDLPVKGAGQTLKVGTVIKSIRLTSDPEEIDCRYEGIKGLVLRTEFVKKR